MTRFHHLTVVSALLGAAAWWLGGWTWVIAVAAIFFIVTGLGVTFPQLQFFGPYVCRSAGVRRCVALTFDDGPDARSTPALLDLLREAGVEAAFFCVGERVAQHPELAARIVGEGHLIANHSHAHSNFTNFFSVSRLTAELVRAQEAIRAATGVAPSCFRPPMGLSNPRVFRVALDLGLTVVGWSARGLDTQIKDPKRIVDRIVRRLEPGGIILLHDGNIPVERLLVTVKTLLDTVRGLGYEVVRLDRMLK